ncbi:hypothetical protein N7533_002010 [Penicillium manginii]|uniref:uncharacterized protein n=1 Tax=Penicillium manginii TaxID=203109 RepID=UPI002548D8E5|nr:uncharacterized protein N7533_002010 [Penicillium manginii]KAJ5763329.1 hypothetical protein N7533_002010 [Penicillium manginii]
MVNLFTTVVGIFTRLIKASIGLTPWVTFAIWLEIRDLFYLIANRFRPSRPVGRVVLPGHPGHGGIWPSYLPPTQGKESRSPCPGLNTLANHNILPRDGRKITYKQLTSAIQHAFNFSPTLADQLTASAKLLDQGRGWIDLHDLNALNVIQHDASITRPDIAFCPDQGYPHPDLVENFLAHSSNGKSLTLGDIATFSGKRRAECKRSNGQYSMTGNFLHEFIGSGGGELIYSIFGGNVDDLRVFLTEERFPEGWEPRTREAFGHTVTKAQLISLIIEFNINEA